MARPSELLTSLTLSPVDSALSMDDCRIFIESAALKPESWIFMKPSARSSALAPVLADIASTPSLMACICVAVAPVFDWICTISDCHLDACLTLSTIHQSKGKEWPYVFVVGVNVDVLPHCKGDPMEERRIYFVACSRAAKKLHVSANGVPSSLIKHKLPEGENGGIIDPWENFELLQQ